MDMKLTAGLGSVDDYPAYVEAGAEEMFCGYVPGWWTERYGIYAPLNRREVLYYNVQIGSASEMEILRDMIDMYHVPVSITLNALYYTPEQYPLLVRYIEECRNLGFDSFIIADMALLQYLRSHPVIDRIRLTISGEFAEMNREVLTSLGVYSAASPILINRIIFHRKMTPAEMQACVRAYQETSGSASKETQFSKTETSVFSAQQNLPRLIKCQNSSATDNHSSNLEFEAFAMNEQCHFHGAFCNSLHCDELCHICQVPYRLGEMSAAEKERSIAMSETEETKEPIGSEPLSAGKNGTEKEDPEDDSAEYGNYIPGETGCGLCSFWDLREAGITHLKIVGRGSHTDDMIADIRAAATALQILEQSFSREAYISEMKQKIFHSGCSENCYYSISHQ